jgi:hypothetical protein
MAKKGRHIVDRVFAEGLRDAQMPVSNRIWTGLSAQLENQRLRRKVMLWRFTAAASVMLLIGMGTWLFFQSNQSLNTRDFMASGHRFGKAASLTDRCFDGQETLLATQPHIQRGRTLIAGIPALPLDIADAQRPIAKVNTVEPIVSSLLYPTDKIQAALAHARAGLLRARELSENVHRLPIVASNALQTRPVEFAADELPERTHLAMARSKGSSGPRIREFNFDALATVGEQEIRKPSRWEVGGAFAPDMTFESVTPYQSDNAASSSRILADDATKADTKRLSPVMAYSTGVRAGFVLNDRFTLRGAVMYTNRQTTTSAEIATYKTESYQSNLSLNYLEVPVSVKYNIIHNKHLDYFVSTGVSGNLFLSYQNYLSTADGSVAARKSSESGQAFKPSQANALISTGLQCRLGRAMSFNVEPGLRYGFAKNDYAFSKSRAVSMNLSSSLNYHF